VNKAKSFFKIVEAFKKDGTQSNSVQLQEKYQKRQQNTTMRSLA
jgi:hypothetical protein